MSFLPWLTIAIVVLGLSMVVVTIALIVRTERARKLVERDDPRARSVE